MKLCDCQKPRINARISRSYARIVNRIREGGIQLSKEDVIRVDGVVDDISSNIFNVTLTNGQTIRASLAGKLRIHHIRILPGDKVTVELSPYDLTNGRIVYRNK